MTADNAPRSDGSAGDHKGSARREKPAGGSDSGAEASRGIHSAGGPSASDERGADVEGSQESLQGDATDEDVERPGSEPLRHRTYEHESGYGGRGGDPRASTDEREGTSPSDDTH
jgi:hypothetical protein